uniref:NADH-ubiquinone oxidoreductase chain 5 n=1 Tax=Thaumaglossa rufocapillata TaxID=3080387 RepID=A0AA96WLZ0_9COLE|nr:NADH dehydrogenase subunit 5 [Thaumaglossa rufocapillata]WNZ33696.1 NADH dehydrogenase subunit 5 [Thaumaglossa rufocapillata]
MLMFLVFISFDYSVIFEFVFFNVQSSSIVMTFLLDWMSLLFCSFVFFISSMVVYYSYDYMSGDLTIDRFILLVIMFVASMMLMILSPNLVSILLGWDGLGLVSYCLVIYYQNFKSFNAGMLTFLTNRIGDVALLISIGWLFNYGGWNYVFWLDILKVDNDYSLISFLVIIACMTKSAQIPFSSWLPAAMAAPTPVSSLVHSSTLVTAGVYLLIRFFNCFVDQALYFLLFFSSLTMFMAGLGANYEYDLKKIVAMSTLSQLGLMISILSMGEYYLSFFHLLVHALFKALLFMCSGNFIHGFLDCQDIRYMGGLVNFMPLSCSFFNICNLSLCGIPFFSGFYSKDLIIEVLSMEFLNFYIYLVFLVSTGLTISYTFRLLYYSLMGDYNYISAGCISDSSTYMVNGMGGLIFFVLVSGSLLSWLIFPTPYFICLPVLFKLMVLLIIILGSFLGYYFSKMDFVHLCLYLNMLVSFSFLGSMWNMPYFSTVGLMFYPLKLGFSFYKFIDLGWSENFGGYKLFILMKRSSLLMQFLYFNNLKIYLLMLSFLMVFFLMFYI